VFPEFDSGQLARVTIPPMDSCPMPDYAIARAQRMMQES
jgi:hypothetical protein